MGCARFGIVYILSQYLGQVQRYNAAQIGKVLEQSGGQLALIPFVPLRMKRLGARRVGIFGINIFAGNCFMNMMLSPDTAGDQLLLPNLIRALGRAHPRRFLKETWICRAGAKASPS